ncbi:MAG: hypothetical protein U5K79_08175 [Cyclobacteriaceae bacterium]|nr:hypothetical protein [Cyclobacteriaceae bacterium]
MAAASGVDLNFFAIILPLGTILHNYHLTNTYGGNLNSWIQSELGKTASGLNSVQRNIMSNVLGEEMDPLLNVPGEDADFTKSKTRQYCLRISGTCVLFKSNGL